MNPMFRFDGVSARSIERISYFVIWFPEAARSSSPSRQPNPEHGAASRRSGARAGLSAQRAANLGRRHGRGLDLR